MRRPGPGSPEPLGVSLAAGGANVAVHSAHATAIELCLFDAAGERETERIALPERTGDVFHGFVPGVTAGARYGLRAHGPWAPAEGHRFNAAKLLVDPYATALDRRFALHPSVFGALPDGVTRDEVDSAPVVPRAIVSPHAAPAPAGARVPWGETVIYELHARGFTQSHPGVPAAIRGTLAGLAHPAALEHLARLGVTTVELMPLAAWVDERHLPPLGLANYWGYNPVALLAPDPALAPGGMAELAACVEALHAAGLEVLLDVVLNHTGEGDEHGPTLSLRGLDNATYYRLAPGNPAHYANDAGCGNTLALERAPVARLALDALRHWATAGVDGFRFDLATTLARTTGGFDPQAPFLQAIAQDPVLRGLKLVAEPWDVGPGGHRLGAFPAAWGEWNDRYRDAVRRFWRGDAGLRGELATRLAGSADVFAASRRPPSRSVNFVTAHDGFTLADLVAHGAKHNEANGEANRDGTDANCSWNHGTEGATGDPRVVAARRADARALLATLLASRGTPMLSMGDELGRTQRGNNNAYAQDNALSWVDWAGADGELTDFVARLVRLRRRHRALRLDRWLAGEPRDATGIPDVEWRRPDGRPMAREDWEDPHGRALVAALHAPAEGDEPGDRVAVAFNAGDAAIAVAWPHARDGWRWRRAVDTATASGEPDLGVDDKIVSARSVAILVEERDASARPAGVEPAVLERLATASGIAPRWHDVTGVLHEVGEDTRHALLAAMGRDARTTAQARERLALLAAAREARRIPVATVCREGAPLRLALAPCATRHGRGWLRLVDEAGRERRVAFDESDCDIAPVVAADGRTVARRLVALPALPVGAWRVRVEDEDAEGTLLVAPRACHLPAALPGGARRFGLAAHLYALRRPGDQGIGDFTALAQAARATAAAGGALVGVNPLHALFGLERERASPYHPSDRRFLDPAYVDVAALPGFAAAPAARSAIAALPDGPAIDYPAAWAAKSAALDACFEAFSRLPSDDARALAFHRFVAQGGERLRRFAAFEAIAATRPGVPWQRWPAELRNPDDPAVARFASRHAREVDLALWMQWVADEQLGAAARGAGLEIGLYRDLAVGAAPDGAEAWDGQAALARGVSVGAPPDPFCAEGQVWNLPPPLPDAMAEAGYAAFRTLVAANARHAGALRIDHVLGLARQFWVPDGATALEGSYVRFPFDDLLGALALESARARCLIVGEDLGTVPEGLRERLAQESILSYRVLWFERDGADFRAPSRYPALAAACVSTHDLPTIRGWWAGADLDERRALGLATDEETAAARAARLDDRARLQRAVEDAGATGPAPESGDEADRFAAALHRFIAATPCALALVQADDLAGETTAVNLPGTDRERPNWRRRLAVPAADLWRTPLGQRASADFADRRAPTPDRE
ncbi:MAG: glycogen debranching protein GlgX [Burkholderiales bacterium]|nr:glycogen debranching protein GlgX [Burkholderiales bacterium]